MKTEETLEMVKELLPLLDVADEFKPVVTKAVHIAAEFLSELKTPLEDFRKFSVEQKLATLNQVKEAGFSEEVALRVMELGAYEKKAVGQSLKVKK